MHRLIQITFLIIFSAQFLFSGEAKKSHSGPVRIFIIAGQSNAINIHADADELELSLIDTSAMFYYHCGMPPLSGYPFFSTSGNKWTVLGIQRQVPYLAQHEYFFGPEITLINRLGRYYDNLAVIKCAYGGSNLASDWNRDAVSGNMLYSIMMEQINLACSLLDSAGTEYSFAGFFWIQGESDAANFSYAQAYLENLKKFINGVRSDLNNPELPFFISRLPSGQPYNYLSIVRDAQIIAAQQMILTKCIDTDTLDLDTDNIHFVASGIKDLGFLFAETFTGLVSSNDEFSEQPAKQNIILRQNYPNPFNPTTTITFSLAQASYVKLAVYNTLGEVAAVLINEIKEEGKHEVNFNAADLPSGIYFAKMEAEGRTQTIKIMLLK